MVDEVKVAIEEIIEASQGYAESAVNNAEDALDRAMSGFITIREPDALNVPPINPEQIDAPDAPAFIYTAPIIGAVPTAPALNNIFIPELKDIGAPPELNLSTPTRHAPAPFTVLPPTRPGGIEDDLDTVAAPAIVDHAAPILNDVNAPVKPAGLGVIPSTPVVQADAPGSLPDATLNTTIGTAVGESRYELEVDVDSDAPVVAIFDKAYNAALPVMRQNIDRQVEAFIDRFAPGSTERLVELEELMDDYLDMSRTNNTGLPENVEQGIYDRARARSREEARMQTSGVLKEVAVRGFTLPGGMVVAALDQAKKNEAAKNSEAALTIMAQQADLEQRNIQFAISTATQLRLSVRDAAIAYTQNLVAVNGQAADYANKIADTLVSAYEEYRKHYAMYLDYVKLLAEQFQMEINSALAQIEIYKTDMEAARLESSLRKDEVDLYNSKIGAEESKVRMYAARLQALSVELEKRSLSVDLFAKDVQAYSVQAGVKETETRIYEATLKGDKALVDAELSKMQAYSIEADAIGSQASAISSIANAKTATNRSIVDIFEAELAAFRGTLDAERAKTELPLTAHRANLEAYKTQLQKVIADNRTAVEIADINMKSDSRLQILERETWKAIVDSAITQMNTNAQTGVSAAGVYANLAGSALSAQNTVVQLAHRKEQFEALES